MFYNYSSLEQLLEKKCMKCNIKNLFYLGKLRTFSKGGGVEYRCNAAIDNNGIIYNSKAHRNICSSKFSRSKIQMAVELTEAPKILVAEQ